MGFWDVVGDMANAASDMAQNERQRMHREYDRSYDRYSDMDDESLKDEARRFRNGDVGGFGLDMCQKMKRMDALSDVLKERGLIK